MTTALAGLPAGSDSTTPAPPEAANDNGPPNPTIVDLPREIPGDRARRLAEVLARILVARALVVLGIQPAVDE